MVQLKKPEVREELLRAAALAFAERGYVATNITEVAKQAGVSTGNVYRYFENKEALFAAVIPADFAAEFLRLIRKRVASLAASHDLTQLSATARRDETELLEFWIAHRLRAVVLLDGAAGTPYEQFGATLAEDLTKLALAKLRQASGGRRLRPVVRFTLESVFDGTVRTLGAILREHETDAAIREAFAAFWSYQLAGLAGLERWVTT